MGLGWAMDVDGLVVEDFSRVGEVRWDAWAWGLAVGFSRVKKRGRVDIGNSEWSEGS